MGTLEGVRIPDRAVSRGQSPEHRPLDIAADPAGVGQQTERLESVLQTLEELLVEF